MANFTVDKDFEREMLELKRKLMALSSDAKKESQTAFRQAAPLLISAIQGRAPQSDAPHYRYDTPKLAKKLRAPNGGGRIVAKYIPGNLRRSFRTFAFRKAAAIWVGPKVAKGDASGVFSGNRSDAYYAHWTEYGAPEVGLGPRPFVAPAVAAAGPTTLRLAAELLKRIIEKNATR